MVCSGTALASNKTGELSISINNIHLARTIYLTEHHMKAPEILQVKLENYTLGASYCRTNMAKGRVTIFVKKNKKFKQI
jgi:hypothetical protein